jgi:hypothetical protein
MKWKNLLGKILVPGLGPWGAKAPDRTGQGRVGVEDHTHSTLPPVSKGGGEEEKKTKIRQLLSERPELILETIRRRFGQDIYEALVDYIRSRCEEDDCRQSWDYVCDYCGKRLCKAHAVISKRQPAYCKICSDSRRRLDDTIHIIRSPWDVL